MKENFSFKYLGQLPSFEECLSLVQNFGEDDWLEYKDRKRFGGIAAENSDTIPITYNPNPSSKELINHRVFDEMSKYVSEISNAAVGIFGDISVRQSMLTRLRAGDEIRRHKDKGPITAVSHRVHLSIVTNDLCLFSVGDESINMTPGSIWAIDNVDKYHSVSNGGRTDRIHLIIDFVKAY